MINEEINDQTMNVAGQVGQATIDEIKKLIEKLLAKLEEIKNKPPEIKEPELKQGKQTLKQLQEHSEGLSTVELKNPNLRELYHAMKKDGVDFAAVKDGKGKYTLFFKGKDVDTLTHAFKRYTNKLVKLDKGKPSINKALAAAKVAAQALNAGRGKVKNRSKGAIDI